MSDFLDRLKKEHEEVLERSLKLWKFMQTEKYKDISKYQQQMLFLQHKAMAQYVSILQYRLTDFGVYKSEGCD